MSVSASYPPRLIVIAAVIMVTTGVMGRPVSAHVEQDMPPALAVMEYRILLEFKPGEIRTRLKFAAALEALKRYDEAEKELKTVLTTDPDNFNAIDLLGLVRLRQGKTEESLSLLNKAIALKPADVMVFYHLGLTWTARAEKKKAMAAFASALRNNRKSSGKNRKKWQAMIIKARKEAATP